MPLKAIKTWCKYQDFLICAVLLTVAISGNRVVVALEAVPEESNIAYLSYTVSQAYFLQHMFA